MLKFYWNWALGYSSFLCHLLHSLPLAILWFCLSTVIICSSSSLHRRWLSHQRSYQNWVMIDSNSYCILLLLLNCDIMFVSVLYYLLSLWCTLNKCTANWCFVYFSELTFDHKPCDLWWVELNIFKLICIWKRLLMIRLLKNKWVNESGWHSLCFLKYLRLKSYSHFYFRMIPFIFLQIKFPTLDLWNIDILFVVWKSWHLFLFSANISYQIWVLKWKKTCF